MIRVIQILFQSVYFLYALGVLVIAFFVSVCCGAIYLVFQKQNVILVFYRIIRMCIKCAFFVTGIRYEGQCESVLDETSHYVVVSNHRSILDISLFYLFLPFPVSFFAKKELFRVPLLRFLMIHQGHFSIDRSNRRRSFEGLAYVVEKLRSGRSCILFPEGTRSTGRDMLPFKRGAFQLAVQSDTPVLPCYLYGTDRVLRKGSFLCKPGKIGLKIGRPIVLGDAERQLSERQQQTWLMDQARQSMEQLQASMKRA